MDARNDAASEALQRPEAEEETKQSELLLPDPQSVKGRVLGALLAGDELTHKDCWLRFGSARLSHHIYMLRGTGWPICMTERTVNTSDADRVATIGVYSLPAEIIAAAGEHGRQYAAECARINAERRAA